MSFITAKNSSINLIRTKDILLLSPAHTFTELMADLTVGFNFTFPPDPYNPGGPKLYLNHEYTMNKQ